jgi:DNA repair exonuclease SbcCD ATPase subunit
MMRDSSRQMRCILCCLLVLAGFVVPGVAAAQRSDDRAQFDARMNVLQRSLAELSAQIEQLKARDQELQQLLEKMRANYDQRLERLEKGAASRAAPPSRSRP